MSSYQPKVNQTKTYSDSQGEHIVHEGRLILLRNTLLEGHKNIGISYRDKKRYSPIIISETEEIEVGDWILLQVDGNKEITKAVEIGDNGNIKTDDGFWKHESICSKILALPEHFSDKHLQAIVDGKMKEGEVLVKCRHRSIKTGRDLIGHTPAGEPTYIGNYNTWKEIHLNQQNHITLYPVQQSLEKAFLQWHVDNMFGNDPRYAQEKAEEAFKAGAEWAKKNNY